MIPVLLAANPLPVMKPAQVPAVAAFAPAMLEESLPTVDTFDPVARARVLAQQMPRRWSGTYQAFGGGVPVPVQLSLASATAFGQMVDVRGTLTVGSVTSAVQGNLNAKSDQLDLIVLGGNRAAGLEDGGAFLGLQAFSLSGWNAPRLTNQGGELVLNPVQVGGSGRPVRGLW